MRHQNLLFGKWLECDLVFFLVDVADSTPRWKLAQPVLFWYASVETKLPQYIGQGFREHVHALDVV